MASRLRFQRLSHSCLQSDSFQALDSNCRLLFLGVRIYARDRSLSRSTDVVFVVYISLLVPKLSRTFES